MKYAVYIIVLEDTEENDMRVMADCEEGDRIAGDLTSNEASAILRSAQSLPGRNSDIAR